MTPTQLMNLKFLMASEDLLENLEINIVKA